MVFLSLKVIRLIAFPYNSIPPMNPYKQALANSTNKHITVDTAIHIHSSRDRQQ